MAITVTSIGTFNTKSPANGDVLASSVTLAAADTLFVIVGLNNADFTNTTFLWNGNTLSQDAICPDGSRGYVGLFRYYSAAGGTSNVTVSDVGAGGWDGAASCAASIFKVSGLAASSLDVTAAGGSGNGVTWTAPDTPATATTAQADEIAIGGHAMRGPTGDTDVTTNNGDTATRIHTQAGTSGASATSNVYVDSMYSIKSSTGTFQHSWSGATAREGSAVIGTYKGAGAGSIVSVNANHAISVTESLSAALQLIRVNVDEADYVFTEDAISVVITTAGQLPLSVSESVTVAEAVFPLLRVSSTPQVFDRVMMDTTTVGTGSVALGVALPGFRDFDSALTNGQSCYYCIEAVDAGWAPTGDWEVGTGTYIAAATALSRDSVLASSNSNSLVDFSAGTKRVFVTVPATFVNTPRVAYAPTWTCPFGTAPTLGNGTITGSYVQIGKMVFFEITLTAGSTTTFGSNDFVFSLPVAANPADSGLFNVQTFDTSATKRRGGFTVLLSPTTIDTFDNVTEAPNHSTNPFTWANGDQLRVSGSYVVT